MNCFHMLNFVIAIFPVCAIARNELYSCTLPLTTSDDRIAAEMVRDEAQGQSAPVNDDKTSREPSVLFQHPVHGISYDQYSLDKEGEFLPQIRDLITKDLSEPYSIYVYRYFLYQWAELCFMALDENRKLVGVVICKLEPHRGGPLRGYIAMLATKEEHRGRGIAITLVSKAIDLMIEKEADEIALETEETNTAAMKLYEKLGFLRSKKLHRYYLNGNSAYRLLLYLKPGVGSMQPAEYDPYGDMPPSAGEPPDDARHQLYREELV